MNNHSELVRCGHISMYPLYTNTSSPADMVSDIAACVVNIILSVLTTIGNASVILAYHRNRDLQTKSNLLIVALALTDIVVGICVQPSFVWVKITQMTGTIHCPIEIASDLSTKFCIAVSLLTLGVVISGERYLAIFHPFKHYTWVTKKKLQDSVVFVWFGVATFILIIPLGVSRKVYQSLGLVLILLNLLTSVSLYSKIAAKLRKAKSQIGPASEIGHACSNNVLRISTAQQINGAVTSFYVLGGLFICYLPMLAGFIYVPIYGQDLFYQKFLWTWGVTFIFLNSFCNPFIYSWRNRRMSSAIRRLFVKNTSETSVANISVVRCTSARRT